MQREVQADSGIERDAHSTARLPPEAAAFMLPAKNQRWVFGATAPFDPSLADAALYFATRESLSQLDSALQKT